MFINKTSKGQELNNYKLKKISDKPPWKVYSMELFLELFPIHQRTVIDVNQFELNIDPGKFIAHVSNTDHGQYWTYFGQINGRLFIHISDQNPTRQQ